jgi:hypothetical protein
MSIFQIKKKKNQQKRSRQVRIAIQSSKIENSKAPVHSFACYGQKLERTIFKRTTSFHFKLAFFEVIFPPHLAISGLCYHLVNVII